MPKSIWNKAGAKTTVVLLSVLLFLLLLSSTSFAVTRGDVNEDGAINVLDVVLVMQHILGIADPELTDSQIKAADANCDGAVDVNDAFLIMRYALNLIDEFPPCPMEVSVEATGKKVITVRFTQPVTDTGDADITVRRGTSTVPVSHITKHWDDTGSKVELRRSVDYDPGNYVITIKGLGLDKVHYNLTIYPEKVGRIEITSPNLVIAHDDARKARGHYRVYNQYGEDITTHRLASELEWVTSLGEVAQVEDNNDGTFVDNNDGGTFTVRVGQWETPFKVGDTITVTVIDPPTGVKEVRTVGMIDTMIIKEFEFGEVTPLPPPRERVEVGWNPAARIMIDKAVDDGGVNRITFGELQGQITLISSDKFVGLHLADKDYGYHPALKDYGYHPDKQAAIYVDTRFISTGRTIDITVVINATGETFTMPLTIHQEGFAHSVEIGRVADGRTAGDRSDVIAAKRRQLNNPQAFVYGTGDEQIYIPLTIRDQFGEARTSWQVASDYVNNRYSLESSNHSVIHSDDLSIETAYNSPYRGYLKIDQVFDEGYTNIKVTVRSTNNYGLKEVEVSPARKPAKIYLPAGITRLTPPYYRMSEDSTRNFEFYYRDQYDDRYEAISDDRNYSRVNVTLKRISGDVNALRLAPLPIDYFFNNQLIYRYYEIDDAQMENYFTLLADANKAGLFKLTGILWDYYSDDPTDVVDLYEAKTYISVVEEVPETFRSVQVSNLPGDRTGQTQDFVFELEERMFTGSEVIIEIPDSEGVRYSDNLDHYNVTGALGSVIDVKLGDMNRNPVITFRSGFIPSGRTVTITADNVNTSGITNVPNIEVRFTREDSGESLNTTFNVGF